MKKPFDASFIIVNYNGKKFLKRLIESIQNQINSTFEIIIVDNASTDGSVEYITKYFPKIKLIKSPNVGFGRGCNLGAKSAKGKFLVFLNPDVYLTKNYLENYLKFYHLKSLQYPEPIGCLGCPNLEFDTHPTSIRIFGGGILDIFGTPRESSDPKKIDDSVFAYGTGLFINKKVFNKVKGFTPNVFLYSEEIDLCWRLKTRGYRHLVDNNNLFYHVGGGSKFGDNRPRQIALMTYGCFLATFTNFQTITLIFVLPLYIFYLLAIIIFLPIIKNFNFNYVKEIFFAFKRFYWDFKNIVKFRNYVQNTRSVSDIQLAKYFSLIPSILLH